MMKFKKVGVIVVTTHQETNMRKVISQQRFGEKNSQWKGNKVGYVALHNWVRRHKLKPLLCEECNKNKAYDLANISGGYKRDIDDFKWLCRSCHTKYDYSINKRKPKRGTPRRVENGLFECLGCFKMMLIDNFHKSNLEKYGIRKFCKNCRNKKHRDDYKLKKDNLPERSSFK